MTGGTIFFDPEGSLSIVAGPTRLPVFHFLHTNLITIGLSFKNIRMTLVATKHFCMHIMSKGHYPDTTLDINSFGKGEIAAVTC